jgi:acetyltransferase-like isoleucine patch superfamily enzyme
MGHLKGFISKNADVSSALISSRAIIYGKSKIDINAIIDPFVIIGYPIRSRTQKIVSKEIKNISIETKFDQVSSGSKIGKKSHIRSFTTVYESSTLEENVETGTNVVIRENCHIGSGSIIGSSTILDSKVIIGKNARIQSNNFIPPKIVLGDNVFLGPGVKFANDKYPVSSKLISTVVKDDVVIGIGAIILPGLRIGMGAIIAAGSIVTSNVDQNSVVMGSPAKQIMTKEEYEKKRIEYEG